MGIRVTIGPRGVVTEDLGPGAADQVIIPSAGSSFGVLTADVNGWVSQNFLAQKTRYEFHDHSGSQAIPTGSYTTISCNGINDQVDGGLYCWSTSSSVFRPEKIGSVYTLRFTGKVLNPSRNGIVHIDFALSGALPPNYVPNYNRQKQGHEYQVVSSADHVDLALNVHVFADAQLLASGGMFYMTTTTNLGLTLMSSSIMIKEG